MVDVEEGDLTVLLTEDEEECVDKLNEFGEVEPPHSSSKLWGK